MVKNLAQKSSTDIKKPLGYYPSGFFQYFNGSNLIGYYVDGWNGTRLSSFFGKELILGSYLSRLLPIFTALLIINEKNFKLYNFLYM